MVSFSLLFVWKECEDNPMSDSQPIYCIWEIARLPCTHITDISLEIWKCRYIISHYLTCICVVVMRVFQTELFCLISPEFLYILSVTDGRHLQLNTQSLQKSVLVSVLGNFLVNSKCLYLLWKFLINQQWWNEVFQSREK